jgi:hypothetical protein
MRFHDTRNDRHVLSVHLELGRQVQLVAERPVTRLALCRSW